MTRKKENMMTLTQNLCEINTIDYHFLKNEFLYY